MDLQEVLDLLNSKLHGAVDYSLFSEIFDAVASIECEAQAVPDVKQYRSVTLTCAQLREALNFGAPDNDDQEQLETEMTIVWSEVGHSGKGYYCYYSELPEEGAIFLDGVDKAQEPNNE